MTSPQPRGRPAPAHNRRDRCQRRATLRTMDRPTPQTPGTSSSGADNEAHDTDDDRWEACMNGAERPVCPPEALRP